jgi:hypothetical protein
MTKSTFSRHDKIRVAAVSLVGGIIIGACSPVLDQPAPVYMVPITSSAAPDAVAAAPIEREAMAPVALAPSMAPATAAGHPASDVIALDNPPPQPMPAPARQAADPTAAQAMLPPPSAAPAPTPALAASPAPASPLPAAAPVAASARPEPSAAAEVRAEPASPPAPERTAEPARADIATPGLLVSMKGDRAARSRPRYYYSP